MLTNQEIAIVRDLRADYKFKWLEQILKEVIKEAVEELRANDERRRENEKTKPIAAKPLSIQDVADRYNKSKATVHNWMKQGIIKGFKMGKGRFFYIQELETNLTKYDYLEILEGKGLIEKRKKLIS